MAYASDYEDYLNQFRGKREPPEQRTDWKERRDYLRQQSEIGGLFLSDEATEQLKTFHREYSVAIDQIEIDDIVEGVYEASKRCLEAMLTFARKDLKKVEVEPSAA
jgi:hypothetical protein